MGGSTDDDTSIRLFPTNGYAWLFELGEPGLFHMCLEGGQRRSLPQYDHMRRTWYGEKENTIRFNRRVGAFEYPGQVFL